MEEKTGRNNIADQVEKPDTAQPAARRTIESGVRKDSLTEADYKYAELEALNLARQESRQARQEEAQDLGYYQAAMKERQIISCEINSAIIKDGDVCAVSFQNAATIYIPFNQLFMEASEAILKAREDDRANFIKKRNMVTETIGVTVDVIITSIQAEPDSDDVSVMASRTAALSRLRSRYFGSNARFPVKKGSDVMGTVLTVGHHGLYACACGTDVRIPKEEMGFQYIEDLKQFFKPGDTMMFRIAKLSVPAENQLPKMELSRREIDLEEVGPKLARIDRTMAGARTTATVISVRKEQGNGNSRDKGQSVVITLYLDSLGVPATARTINVKIRDKLHSGDKVYFEIYGRAESGNFIHGKILKVLP